MTAMPCPGSRGSAVTDILPTIRVLYDHIDDEETTHILFLTQRRYPLLTREDCKEVHLRAFRIVEKERGDD